MTGVWLHLHCIYNIAKILQIRQDRSAAQTAKPCREMLYKCTVHEDLRVLYGFSFHFKLGFFLFSFLICISLDNPYKIWNIN